MISIAYLGKLGHEPPDGFFTTLFVEARWGGPIFHFFVALFAVWAIFFALAVIKRDSLPAWAAIPAVVIPQFLMGGSFVYYSLFSKVMTETLGISGGDEGYSVSWLLAHVHSHNQIVQCAGMIAFLGLVANTITLIAGGIAIRRAFLANSNPNSPRTQQAADAKPDNVTS